MTKTQRNKSAASSGYIFTAFKYFYSTNQKNMGKYKRSYFLACLLQKFLSIQGKLCPLVWLFSGFEEGEQSVWAKGKRSIIEIVQKKKESN